MARHPNIFGKKKRKERKKEKEHDTEN